MSPGDAWIDLAWLIAAIAGIFTLLILRATAGLFLFDHGSEIVVQPFAIGIVLLLVTRWLLRRRGQTTAAIGLARYPVSAAVGWGLLAWLFCVILNAVIVPLLLVFSGGNHLENVLAERTEMIQIMASAPPYWILPMTLFVGVYEEIVFRGLLLSRLRLALGGSAAASVLVSAALFGLLHLSQGTLAAVQVFLMGVVFAIVATRRCSLWPCVVAHAVWDILAFVMSFALRDYLPQIGAAASQAASRAAG